MITPPPHTPTHTKQPSGCTSCKMVSLASTCCAGRAGKSNQSTSRQAELQLLLMLVLPQGWLLKTGPVQSDVLLPVPAMLNLPVQVPALGMVILLLQCYPGLWALRDGTPEPAYPWVTSVSSATSLSHGGSHGIPPFLVQDQLSLTLPWVASPGCPFPLGRLSAPQCHFCC